MQLEPAKYSKGMLDAFRQVVGAEGAGVLATGTYHPSSFTCE
jgi:hypothetical protein